MHLLLQLEGLLELLLQLFQICLGLVALGFEELEAAFPKGSFFVKHISLLLQLCLCSVKLSSKLLIAVCTADLGVLVALSKRVILLSQVEDFSLIIGNKLLPLLLQIGKLLVQDSSVLLGFRGDVDESFLHLLQLLSLCLVLGFGGFLLFQESLGSVLELSCHLVLVNLDPVLIPLHSPLVLLLHLSCLGLSKLDLLLHECLLLLKCDVLGIEIVFFDITLLLEFVVFLSEESPFALILFLELYQVLLLLGETVLLGFDGVFEGDFGALELGNFA